MDWICIRHTSEHAKDELREGGKQAAGSDATTGVDTLFLEFHLYYLSRDGASTVDSSGALANRSTV